MLSFIRVAYSEFHKELYSLKFVKLAIIGTVIWPIIQLSTTFFIYRGVDPNYQWLSNEELTTLLITGALIWNFFWASLHCGMSAFFDKKSGRLEGVYLSTYSLLPVIIGKVFASILSHCLIATLIFNIVLLYLANLSVESIFMFCLVQVFAIVNALLWGCIVVLLFIITPKATLLFEIFSRPINTFSGVRLDLAIAPFWFVTLGLIFPMSYSIIQLRGMLVSSDWEMTILVGQLSMAIIMVIAVYFLQKFVEKKQMSSAFLSR